MATLVRVLMLVACLPLLQPTGFCICKAGNRTSVLPGQLSQVQNEGSHSPSSDCDCRHCKGLPTAAAAGETNLPPAPVPVDSHLPGCPASPGVDCFKWIEPVQPVALDLPTAEVISFLPVEAFQLTTIPAIVSTAWPSSPPLYLSHCSFVI